uniref:F-box domain-containing protein n=1 Tax=Ananas comosus var. bracteatus TaxID=296719 RepID=A0A6V7QWM2_ANACO
MKEALRREQTIHRDKKKKNKRKKKIWPQCIISAYHRATGEASKRKRRRRRKEAKEAKVDHISLLPDHLLHEILSLLPYKKVVATATLSRRWWRIWQTVPDVSFTQSYFPSRNLQVEDHAFVNLVDSALRHRNPAVPVRSFSLRMESEIHDKTKLYSWIRYATNYDLQSLNLSLYGSFSFFELPSVFHLPSLRVLCLQFRVGGAWINWPATAFLPSLEKLDLTGVVFAPVAKDAISNSCPILKDWRMIFNCATPELEVKSPLLEFLRLENMSRSMSGLSICGHSIKTVMVFQPNCSHGPTYFKLSAPVLQTLVWFGPPPHSTTIDSVPASLVSTFLIPINFRRSYMNLLYNGSLSTTFTKLHVNRLVVLYEFIKILSEFISDQRDQPNPPAPNYGNLEHLEISADLAGFDSLGVAFLLKHSCKLRTLVVAFTLGFEQNIDYANYFKAKGGFGRGGYWDSHGISLEQLVEISIYRPLGQRYENDFLEFLFRVATSLTKMTVTFDSYKANYGETLKVIKQLRHTFPHVEILVP